MKKLVVVVLIASCVFFSVFANGKTEEASAEVKWPTRTVTVTVGFKAGGDTDYYARMAAQYLEKELGETFVVVNTAGVNGQVAARDVMQSDPDGYNVYFTHTVSWYQEACNTVDGFSYISDFAQGGVAVADRTFAIVMRSNSGIKTIPELVDYLKKNPNGLSSSASYAGLADYVNYQISKNAGVKMEEIDVGSNATDRVVALLNGTVDILAINYSNIADYVATGEIVVLGLCADERCSFLPDVPTLKEQGVDCVATKYYYFNFPKDTDPQIIAKFNAALKKVVESPEFAESIATFNGEPMFMTPEEHTKFALETIDYMKSLLEGK